MSGEIQSSHAAKVEAVQKRTFTRWVNYHLAEVKLKVTDLFVDLDDGVKLINLVEILTSKKLPYKWVKEPKIKIHKLENLSQVLKFIQLQAIPLVNIDAGNINDGNKPAILGLIFSLISRYSVGGGENDLLAWVNKQIQPYNHIDLATNFTDSWKDGKVLSALVDSLKNGLIDTHDLKDPLNDIKKAMKLAEDNYGIPQLLDAGDMANEPDEKSNMTYIALFREYVENEKKKRDDYKTKAPRANMCYAKGEGVEGGYRGRSLPFTIFSRNVNDEPVVGMYAEEFKVKVTDPAGADVHCSYKDNRDGTFACAYTPTKAGPYKVAIDLNASQGGLQPIRGSVYKLNVVEASDPTKSWAEGPGLIRVFDKQPGLFTVFARDVNGKPVVGEQIAVTVDPKDGKKQDIPIDVKDNGDGSYSVRYGPVVPGDYKVGTQIGGRNIRDMPRDVTCYEAVDPSQSVARGPGVTSGEPRVGIEAPFAVIVKDSKGNTIPCGDHDIKISVTGPKGPVDVKINDGGKGIYKCAYTAPVPGDYVVDVKLNGKDIKDNPFKVNIKKPADPNKTYAEGPGLEKAFDDRPNKFRVHAFDEDGRPVSGEPIEVKVVPFGKSPSDAGVPVELKDNGDGTYDVAYRPDKPGDYWIHTTLRGAPIRDMPKKVTCYKGSDPTKTIVEGPGVTGGFAGKPLPFTIRAIDKDGAPVPVGGDEYKVTVDGPNGFKQDVKVTDNKDGTYSGSYVAPIPGDYKVQVGVAHDPRPVGKSPYHLKVKPAADGASSFAVGAGWKEAWDALPTRFTIYAKDEEGKDVPGAEVKVSVRNVTSSADREKHAGEAERMDPYIKKRKEDERKNLILEQKKQREEFETKSKAEGKNYKTEIGTGDFPVEIRDNGDGTYLATYTPVEPGTYEITVTVNGGNIKESPKPIPVHLTKPKIVFWQHTNDAEKAEIAALKKKLAQANEIGRARGLQF